MVKCCIKNCPYNVKPLHRFPANDTKRANWLEMVGDDTLLTLEKSEITNMYICDAHFSDEHKIQGAKKNLSCNAIPTLHVSKNVVADTSKGIQHQGSQVPKIIEKVFESYPPMRSAVMGLIKNVDVQFANTETGSEGSAFTSCNGLELILQTPKRN